MVNTDLTLTAVQLAQENVEPSPRNQSPRGVEFTASKVDEQMAKTNPTGLSEVWLRKHRRTNAIYMKRKQSFGF